MSKSGVAEFVTMNACLDNHIPRNALSNGGSDEAFRPINHFRWVQMFAETVRTPGLARQEIFTNSVR